MNRPYRYSVRNIATGEWTYTDIDPGYHRTHGYIPTSDPKVSIYGQTHEVWIDTRYEARLRLYKYIITHNNNTTISNKDDK